MNEVLKLDKVSFGYTKNLILKDITFSINEGEFVAIIGENGTGKSTLIKLIIEELVPVSGDVIIKNKESIGYVPQLSAATSTNFPITIREVLALNLSKEINRFGKIDRTGEDKINTILSIVDLKGKKNSLYGDLSGGQKQKTMLGKALISNPKLLLLDEPLIGLDELSRKSFLELLHHQSVHHKITVLMITHDLREISPFTDRILQLEEGQVNEL